MKILREKPFMEGLSLLFRHGPSYDIRRIAGQAHANITALRQQLEAATAPVDGEAGEVIAHLESHARQAEKEYGHPAEELLEWEAADLIRRQARELDLIKGISDGFSIALGKAETELEAARAEIETLRARLERLVKLYRLPRITNHGE